MIECGMYIICVNQGYIRRYVRINLGTANTR